MYLKRISCFLEKRERLSCLTACPISCLFRVLVAVEASSSSIEVAGVCDTLLVTNGNITASQDDEAPVSYVHEVVA